MCFIHAFVLQICRDSKEKDLVQTNQKRMLKTKKHSEKIRMLFLLTRMFIYDYTKP